MEQDPNRMPIHTAEQGIEEEGFEEPTGRGEPIEEEVFVDAHGTTNTATDSSQRGTSLKTGLLNNNPAMGMKNYQGNAMFSYEPEGTNSFQTPAGAVGGRTPSSTKPEQSGTRMEEEEEVKDHLLKNLPSKSGSKRPPRSYTGEEYATRKRKQGDKVGGGDDRQDYADEDEIEEDDQDADGPTGTFNSEVEVVDLRKAEEKQAADVQKKKASLEQKEVVNPHNSSIDQAAEDAQAKLIRERLQQYYSSGMRKRVIRKKDVKDSILMTVENFLLPQDDAAAVGGGGGLNEALRSKAKEFMQLRAMNPDMNIHSYGNGIKFLNLPKSYDRATIVEVWKLVRAGCTSSLHNAYLNLMSYALHFLMSIDKDLTTDLCKELAKDTDVEIFAKYLFDQKSTRFQVFSLPGEKYQNDARFNLLRLSEIKRDFAQIISSYLKKFFSIRKYNCRIHWNTQSSGESLISSDISPSSSQAAAAGAASGQNYFQNKSKQQQGNFDPNIVPLLKSDNASRLRDTNFQHKSQKAQQNRKLFFCNPLSEHWFGQKFQALKETPYFPRDNQDCLYFTPLRYLIEKTDYQIPRNNNKKSNKPSSLSSEEEEKQVVAETHKISISPWNLLYREGICNVAGEHTLNDQKDFSLGYYQGAFDLEGKMPEMYSDVITHETNPETNVTTTHINPPTNSFLLQEINLSWTAILSCEDNKDIYPETTFRFLNRKKDRTDFLCQFDSRRKKTTATLAEQPFPRVESDITLKLEDVIMTKEDPIATKVIEHGIADQGFIMLEPTLQVRGKGDVLCADVIEWIMNMSYSGYEGAVEAVQLYEITLYCLRAARRGVRQQKKKLEKEGIHVPKHTMMMEEEEQQRLFAGAGGKGGEINLEA